jgi:raffinose/stachyose/melibiose transport system permease protein
MKPKASKFFMFFGYLGMSFFTIWTIVPFIWLIYSSFKTHREIIISVFALPNSFYLGNFQKAFIDGNLDWFTFNSFILSSLTTVLVVFFATLCGFAFAKFKSKYTVVLYALLMLGLLITVQSALIPIFITEIQLGINNTYLGLLIPYVAFSMPFAIYLAKAYINNIQNEIIEASVLDGASSWQIYKDIIIPISGPIIATISIFTFLGIWNEFVLALTLTSDDSIRTLPVGINSLLGGLSTDYGLQMATLLYGMMPLIIFYIAFRKKILKGFGGGGVKG